VLRASRLVLLARQGADLPSTAFSSSRELDVTAKQALNERMGAYRILEFHLKHFQKVWAEEHVIL